MQGAINDGRPFRLADLAALGLSPRSLRTHVERGIVRRVAFGVYVDGQVPDDVLVRAAALGLVLPAGVAAARATAAWLYGVPPVEPGRHLEPPLHETVSPAGVNGIRRPGMRGSSMVVDSEDLCPVGGVLTTTPARTLLDLARDRDRPHALAYADALLRTGLIPTTELAAALARLDGLPGVEQAREMVHLADPRAESVGESWLRLRYYDAGFPPAVPQLWVSDGSTRYRLDLAREQERAGLEYDGEEFHGPEREPYEHNRRRWFEARGWTVVSFGRRDVLVRSHVFERVVGDVLGVEPRLLSWEARRRTYAGRRWPSRSTNFA